MGNENGGLDWGNRLLMLIDWIEYNFEDPKNKMN
jgi:hypothetical protein